VWWLGPSNLICTLLLFVYSTTFKKRLLSGNIIIAILTAWTLAVLGFASIYKLEGTIENVMRIRSRMLRFTLLYASFAFVISLIREAIKDLEDRIGDAQYGCKTLPIVAGVVAAKTYVLVWLVVLMGSLILVQFYAAQLGWWLAVLYTIVFIVCPLVYVFYKLLKVTNAAEYHHLSSVTKMIMLTGILSLLFFKMYL
jgi:4-hydroxybenzoate polyprenyltransferase